MPTAEGPGKRALAAFTVLYQAVAEGQASSRPALDTTNLVVRSRYDKTLRFEH